MRSECNYMTVKCPRQYCSKGCYDKDFKKYIWKYKFNRVKEEVKEFLSLFYKAYIRKYIETLPEFLLSMFILLTFCMLLNTFIWAVETFIK